MLNHRDLDSEFIKHISTVLDSKIDSVSSLSGGDISSAYKLGTKKDDYFIKTNSSANASKMFKAEVVGLSAISETNVICTPKIIADGSYESTSYLILEYINSKSPTPLKNAEFGIALAKMHQCSSEEFGFDGQNYIGSLIQINKKSKNWVDFYAECRLMPQIDLAFQAKLLQPNEIPSRDLMKAKLRDVFDNIKPSLLHGDLWGGNYMISKSGKPVLIDPAVYFGHSEVDIAMSMLFGGFGRSFYDAYFEILPKKNGFMDRIEIYQLYYLLVHLNLFGSSYYPRVNKLLKKHF